MKFKKKKKSEIVQLVCCPGGASSQRHPAHEHQRWTVIHTAMFHCSAFIVFYIENIMNGIIVWKAEPKPTWPLSSHPGRSGRGISRHQLSDDCQDDRHEVRVKLQLIFGWRKSLPANLALSPSSSSILSVRGQRSVCLLCFYWPRVCSIWKRAPFCYGFWIERCISSQRHATVFQICLLLGGCLF